MRSFLLGFLAASFAVAATTLGAGTAQALSATTTLESRDSVGTRVGGSQASVSADGRWVAFISAADNIVPGDTNGATDVFLRDRVTGQTRAIDLGADGKPAGGFLAAYPEISADGRFVAFGHAAANLGTGSGVGDLFVFDRVAGSLAQIPAPAGMRVTALSIARDGSRLGLEVYSGSDRQVYVADTAAKTMRRISQTPDGTAGNDLSYAPAISADGKWIAFSSYATNLVSGTSAFIQVLMADLTTGALTQVSVGAGGVQPNDKSSYPATSADGCFVAFFSAATNLVAGDEGTTPKIFVRDRCRGEIERISVTNATSANQRTGTFPDISDDGCLVAFVSSDTYSTTGQAAVLRDRCVGVTSRLDVSTNGDAGGLVDQVRLSGGSGRYAIFTSSATGLVAGEDPSNTPDVFLRDRADSNLAPVAEVTVSQDGRRVVADASASRDPDGPTVTSSITFGDGSPAAAGVSATHEYDRGGTYTVTATIRDADGATASATTPVTVADPGGTPMPTPTPTSIPTPTPSGSPTPSPTVAPPGAGVLGGATLSRRRFRAGQGTTLTVELATAATVELRFARVVRGRRKAGRCSAKARRGARCRVFKAAGTLRRDLEAGTSPVELTATVGSRKLKPGKYRLTVSAGEDTRTLTFTIARPR